MRLYYLFLLLLISACKPAPERIVETGLEVLRKDQFRVLQGKRVGLITNPTGVDKNLQSTIDILATAPGVNLAALYGPEHGVRGDFPAGAKVDSMLDVRTGFPVFSLYGKHRKPSPEMLKEVDVLVYDIQDIGVRSYTYISTMGLVMEAAAENGKEVVVLDRPNPLGGLRIEGCIREDSFASFVSQFPIPYVYGLTCGELANLLNGEGMLKEGVKCKLTVVPMKGWKRSMTFEQTGLPWVPPSPHIPHAGSPYFYAMTGIVGELNPNLIGVGYTLPFQTFAMPWLHAEKLAEDLNQLNLDGIIFRPIHFKPYYMPLKDSTLHGVQIHVTDPARSALTPLQFYFLEMVYKQNPAYDFFEKAPDRIAMFDKVAGSDTIRKTFQVHHTFESIRNIWEKDVAAFRKVSEKYYLYP